MKKLSIIIPTYNEEQTIINILQRINETKSENIDYEIIVIDDCSNDGTVALLEQNKSLYTKLIKNERNLGKGGAVKVGINNVSGDYVIFQDADLEYDPIDIKKFANVFLRRTQNKWFRTTSRNLK